MIDIYKNLTKYGKTQKGTQRYLDKTTNKVFIDPMVSMNNEFKKDLAIRLVSEEGVGYRKVGRLLGVAHTTVMKWVLNEAKSKSYNQLVDYKNVSEIEVDEIYYILGKKKEE